MSARIVGVSKTGMDHVPLDIKIEEDDEISLEKGRLVVRRRVVVADVPVFRPGPVEPAVKVHL